MEPNYWPCSLRRLLRLAAALLFGTLLVPSVRAETRTLQELTPIVIGGNAAPGVAGGAFLTVNSNFRANRKGEVLFRAMLADGQDVNDNNNSGLWTNAGGNISLVSRKGDIAPGAPEGMRFIGFEDWELNSVGQAAFHAHWTGSGNDRNEGIWKSLPGGLEIVARTDASAPDVEPPVDAGGIFYVSQNEAGDIGFGGVVGAAGGAGKSANWLNRGGMSELVVIEDMPVPEIPGNEFNSISAGFVVTDQSSTIFRASFGTTLGQGIFRYADDHPVPIVTSLMQAPGFADGVKIKIGRWSVNRYEDIAFNGFSLDNTGATATWLIRDGSLELIAKKDENAPGTETTFRDFGISSQPQMNDRGELVFTARLNNTGDEYGIWTTQGGPLRLLLREGDHAPEMPANVEFQSLGGGATNNRGQLIVAATLQGVSAQSNYGIWATDVGGPLQLIVRIGDMIEVSPGELRTIKNLLQAKLAENGDVIIAVDFTDGTGGLITSHRVLVLDGDYNFDGSVNAADYTVWRNQLGTDEPAADGNFDGVVDALDYNLWKANFGAVRASFGQSAISNAVPEAGTLSLAMLAGLSCLLCRRPRLVRSPRRIGGRL
ncbi:MAG: dockerin type I repeat-containing protein [Pirellulales bacterium]